MLTLIFTLFLSFSSFAAGDKGGKFNVTDMIFHHITDAHEFHVVGDVTVPLPIIAYHPNDGLTMCMSSKFDHGHAEYNGYKLSHGVLKRADGSSFYDFSITKNVFTLLLVFTLLTFLFTRMASFYKRTNGNAAPKGVNKILEPLFLFVKDEIALPNIGEKKYMKFVPYLVAIFFFILFLNLIGLVPFFPGSGNVTGNIMVTLVLAGFTMLVTNFSGNKHYWMHMLAPDVPKFLYPILVPIELLGILIKPFSLMIRLFANISAGHIIILSLVSLVFIFSSVDGYAGQSTGGGVMGAALAVPFVIFMNAIELFVAFLQAYIFTMLSALYIGQAVEEPHHH